MNSVQKAFRTVPCKCVQCSQVFAVIIRLLEKQYGGVLRVGAVEPDHLGF